MGGKISDGIPSALFPTEYFPTECRRNIFRRNIRRTIFRRNSVGKNSLHIFRRDSVGIIYVPNGANLLRRNSVGKYSDGNPSQNISDGYSVGNNSLHIFRRDSVGIIYAPDILRRNSVGKYSDKYFPTEIRRKLICRLRFLLPTEYRRKISTDIFPSVKSVGNNRISCSVWLVIAIYSISFH